MASASTTTSEKREVLIGDLQIGGPAFGSTQTEMFNLEAKRWTMGESSC
jgi:hypothetical protein